MDVRPSVAPLAMRHRRLLRGVAVGAVGAWTVWSFAEGPPLHQPLGEGGTGSAFQVMAAVGAVTCATAAVRFWWVHRERGGFRW